MTLPPLNAIPDFTAGLIYGFTGDQHLDELHTCMTDIDPLIKDAKKAIGDIKRGRVVAGIKDIGAIVLLLPDAFAGCTNPGIKTDIAAIEAWAEVFKHPLELSKIVGMNWLKHGTEVKKDIEEEEADWAAKKFFEAGVATSRALTQLVGPVKPASAKANGLPPINAVPDFTAGFIYGFTGSNHLDELHTCMKDIDPMIKDVQAALVDIKAGNYIHGIESLGKVIIDLPDAVSSCTDPSLKTDIASIEAWAVIFKQPLKLSKTVTKNWLMHGEDIKKNIAED